MVNSNGTKRKCLHKCTDTNSAGHESSYDDFSTICLIWTGLFWILENRSQNKCRKCGKETVQIATELKSVLLKLYKRTSLDPNHFERSLGFFEQFYDCFTKNETINEDKSQQTASEEFFPDSSEQNGFISFFQQLVRSFTSTVYGFIPGEVLEENTTVLRRCPENAFQETLSTTDISYSVSKNTMTDDLDTTQFINERYKSLFKSSKTTIDQRASNLSAKCAATEEKLLRLAEEVNVMTLTVNEVSKQQSMHNKDIAKILSSLQRMEKCFRSCDCKDKIDVKSSGCKMCNKNNGSNRSVYFSGDTQTPKHSTEILNTNLDIDEQETQTKGCRCTNNLSADNDASKIVVTNDLSRHEFSEKELDCTSGNMHELKQEVDTLSNMLEKIISNSRKQYDDMVVTSSELVHKLQQSYNARVKYVHNKYARRLEAVKKSITVCPVGMQGSVDNTRRPVKYCVRDVKIKL